MLRTLPRKPYTKQRKKLLFATMPVAVLGPVEMLTGIFAIHAIKLALANLLGSELLHVFFERIENLEQIADLWPLVDAFGIVAKWRQEHQVEIFDRPLKLGLIHVVDMGHREVVDYFPIHNVVQIRAH